MSSSSTSTAYQFAARLQSALEIADVERAFIENAPHLIGARGYGLYRLDPDSGDLVGVVADVETDFLDEYERIGRADDPVLRFVRRHQRPVDESRAASFQEWTTSGAYEALARAGFYHSLESPVAVAGLACATVNFARRRDDPPFDDRDLRRVRQLSEQVGLALERAVRYEATGVRVSRLEAALDQMTQPVVLTDLDGVTLFSNRSARAGGAESLAAQAASIISEAAESLRGNNRRLNVAALIDPDGSARLMVKSVRLSGPTGDSAMSIIYARTHRQDQSLPSWDLLSPREQAIAQFVSEGLTTKQIAERAFISENTVKQHLKRIFAKVDVHNRAELMQRIWSSRTNGSLESPPADSES